MKKRLIRVFYAAMLASVLLFVHTNEAAAFSDRVIMRGDTGDDVIELQARLQYISFYKGKIDGAFGYGTYWALRNFQSQFGLKIDGMGGAQTKQKLVKASQYDRNFVISNLNAGNTFTYYGGIPLSQQVQKKAQSPSGSATTGKQNQGKYTIDNLPQGYSKSDINLMANAVYGESRGEPYIGQVAVGAVIVNRVADPRFPNNISDVIFQPGAFTAVSDGQIWLTPNESAKKAVMDAINGWDPSNGAIYYFNPDTATSAWIWTRPQIGKIGKHIFCK
ncbi:spore cortex-lytic enzyme [Sporolactobacillus terrae]|uniref:Spore cortex-lytic enzyme n=2 Tax=Sporolactobacillus terrae TaxID=269673 RepID=A0A410D9A0_9BACL|nr:spore cortex-lytic enzyme [Sporolactobacillus terrae]QAA25604.1 spore cortex-lytic enzyme [Sporolactobacillus terrae]UAK17413.1 spore cortex-lytic enzyme [Sporolactobacillus terrae]BBN98956.1 spore cortex-lytic enzyme [Sporolactobacillus terrae]